MLEFSNSCPILIRLGLGEISQSLFELFAQIPHGNHRAATTVAIRTKPLHARLEFTRLGLQPDQHGATICILTRGQ